MRITKQQEIKIDGFSNYTFNKGYNMNDVVNKLGQLEDIGEELGIDLLTLFEALKHGIYGKVGDKIEHILGPHFSWCYKEIYIYHINDYGKTWALTREELENERK